jgi:hypothetical protein
MAVDHWIIFAYKIEISSSSPLARERIEVRFGNALIARKI